MISIERWTYLEHWATSSSAGREQTGGWSRRRPWQNCWWRKEEVQERGSNCPLIQLHFTCGEKEKAGVWIKDSYLWSGWQKSTGCPQHKDFGIKYAFLPIFLFLTSLCQINRTVSQFIIWTLTTILYIVITQCRSKYRTLRCHGFSQQKK